MDYYIPNSRQKTGSQYAFSLRDVIMDIKGSRADIFSAQWEGINGNKT
jgi:hypothetical protein